MDKIISINDGHAMDIQNELPRKIKIEQYGSVVYKYGNRQLSENTCLFRITQYNFMPYKICNSDKVLKTKD